MDKVLAHPSDLLPALEGARAPAGVGEVWSYTPFF